MIYRYENEMLRLQVPEDIPKYPDWLQWRDAFMDCSRDQHRTMAPMYAGNLRYLTFHQNALYFLRRNKEGAALDMYVPLQTPVLLNQCQFQFSRLLWHRGADKADAWVKHVLENLNAVLALNIL